MWVCWVAGVLVASWAPLAASAAAPPVREVINFDFAWRHHLGAVPDPNRKCGNIEKGVNYGTGGNKISGVANASACCDLCAGSRSCAAWDWNPTVTPPDCWLKQDASGPVKADRYSGVIPPPEGPPAAALPGFDDSGWEVVDAPHDMLIEQAYAEANGPSQAFLPRNEGWYRKHFALPADWTPATATGGAARSGGGSDDSSAMGVWVYFEGVFHVTTGWLNGVELGAPHLAGYTSFAWRIDNVPGVRFGDLAAANVLAVHVDATFGTGWWYEGGGLFRHQFLVRANAAANLGPDGSGVFAHGDNITDIAPDKDGGLVAASAVLHASATVHNSNSNRTLSRRQEAHGAHAARGKSGGAGQVSARFTLMDADGAVVAGPITTALSAAPPANSSVTVATALPLRRVSLWSVPRPYLYTLLTEVLAAPPAPAGPAATATATATATAAATATVVDAFNTSSIGFRTINFTADAGLQLNGQHVKLRGFCDHSNFGGVGSAVPDRVNLFRAQALRDVGGNAWRMAHNPPIQARLDITDALGVVVMDENRDYGGSKQQGGTSRETGGQQLADMGDLVTRDRNRASVLLWSFCNEVGCNNETWARAFRGIAYADDGTRPVTQNHLGTSTSTRYLDVQGFSHKSGDVFDAFHAANPAKPTLATECCSCLSQRGVDEDTCPNPRPGGCKQGCRQDCHGSYQGDDTDGEFYNNDIGQCTASQVLYSDSREYVSGTFIWSGFDYYGESRGWPQTVKCRGTVADVAGFPKETSHWIRAWWLANVSATDAGRPSVRVGERYTVALVEAWAPGAGAAKGKATRLIHAYASAASVELLLNGEAAEGGARQDMPHFGLITWPAVTYKPGNLTAVARDAAGAVVATHSVFTAGAAVGLRLSLDAPNAAMGTGSALVADGEDTAMVRAEVVDSEGNLVPGASHNVTFRVASGGGRVTSTHSGGPNSHVRAGSPSQPAYHGLVRAYVRSTEDRATPALHRRRLREIDVDAPRAAACTRAGATTRAVLDGECGVGADAPAASGAPGAPPAPIVVTASAPGLTSAQLQIPLTTDLAQLPRAVATREGRRGRAGR